MWLSMMVVMTSCAPVTALSTPAIAAHSAPVIMPTTIASSMCSGHGSSSEKPIQPAPIAARIIWPWPPMLNRPARKPTARPRPEPMSGVA